MIDSRDARLAALYTGAVAKEPRGEHPSPEDIAAVVERRRPEPERLVTLSHIAECPQCRREFDLIRSADKAGRQLTSSVWRARGIGLAVAATLVVAATLSIARIAPRVTTSAPPYRSGEPATGRSIELVGPLSDVSTPAAPSLVWRSVGEDVLYRVEVTDDAGALVASRDTRDTTLTLPPLVRGRTYRWWVRAVVAGEQRRSEFGAFRTNP
jgi:hypothetical protein